MENDESIQALIRAAKTKRKLASAHARRYSENPEVREAYLAMRRVHSAKARAKRMEKLQNDPELMAEYRAKQLESRRARRARERAKKLQTETNALSQPQLEHPGDL